ncbi:FAD-dependent monooxygenase [Rhodococcus sp. IEGM 1351]|uniref:FAD-dependent monooxygenase n=1 Tax=Rhodococcus sp. IEGM 1351 TaxID=3047089 RepID=UPI0024B73346|nr:FAD-dependent monooxygenase [Rhodococcus sp. IEGM 1351]MDI9939209.1 FAD-dependent monooxygenase [Rhodococcus sp. IEGM 1351]
MVKALVVGGGIAGIATGLALSRGGIEVDLVERDEAIRAIGSGITLIAPAMRALQRLEVLDECIENGYGTKEMQICDVNGTVLDVMALPSALGSDLPGMMGMMRPMLHQILLDHAASEGLTVRTGLGPTAIETNSEHATVTFSDGSIADYDLVVGADGIRSTVRDIVSAPQTPVFQEQICYRAVVPRPASVTCEVAFVGCETAHIGFSPTGKDSMYIYCCVPTSELYRPPAEELPEIVRGYLAPFGGVVAELRDGITDPAQVNCAPLETILAPEPWYHGRVVLLGDAAHSTTPHLAAGAAMCLEDAVVLAEEFGTAATVPDALRAYSKRRFERCKYVVETSTQLSFWQTHPDVPGADQEGLRGEAFGILAGAY